MWMIRAARSITLKENSETKGILNIPDLCFSTHAVKLVSTSSLLHWKIGKYAVFGAKCKWNWTTEFWDD